MSRRDPFRRDVRSPEASGPGGPPLRHRVALIVAAAVSLAGAGLAVQRASTRRATDEARAPEAVPAVPGAPIAHEAEVFRTRPGAQAVEPDARRRDEAHPRTIATYRALRSYPGAPPRIPHGVTEVEFRTTRCNTCHERGGYSQRFGAYAPVNPHPERAMCLQCHAPAYELVGVPFPRTGANDPCRQCHAGVPAKFSESAIAWRAAPWPALAIRALAGAPVIPHDLDGRGNCLACHMGPGAVAELRTSHPERADCRQCHVTAGDASLVFSRPARPDGAGAGGVP